MARLNLTRDQLATFLKDPEQIKQFEKLFLTVETVSAASDTQGISASSDSAGNTGNQVLGQVLALEQDLNTNLAVVEAKINSILALIKRPRVGQFYDTTTQTAAIINTAYAMTFNTTDISSGVYLGSPTSRIYVDTEGVYDIQFSAQLDNTSGGNHLSYIWLRVNGADVSQTASQVRLKGTDGELVAAWNFYYKFKAGDYFELMWSVSDVSVQLVAQAAAAPVPAIPSIILTCARIGD